MGKMKMRRAFISERSLPKTSRNSFRRVLSYKSFESVSKIQTNIIENLVDDEKLIFLRGTQGIFVQFGQVDDDIINPFVWSRDNNEIDDECCNQTVILQEVK